MRDSVRRRYRLLGLPAMCVAGVAVAAAMSGCSVGGETCSLNGSAAFTPGLRTGQQAISYTFTGTLKLCSGAAFGDSSIHTATVSASGSGAKVGCTGGNTSGTANIVWNNG